MNAVARSFEDRPATRQGHVTPLIIGITGAQSAGKTWSALRLATGIQRVTGGDIYGVDTDDDRMLHYADYFSYRHVPFFPPHGALHYLAAVDHCLKRGAKIVIVDNMSDEHDGDGGLLDQMDDYIDAKLALPQNTNKSRDIYLMSSQIGPKRDRKKLNRRIVHAARAAVFILCYRAEQKIKPKRGSEPENLGWQTVSTSKLPYSMTVRFLLAPGSNGVPLFQPTVPGEQLLVKNPYQFREWFKEGDQLSEDLGEKLAKWAHGTAETPLDVLIAEYARCADEATFADLEKRRVEVWKISNPRKPQLKAASDEAKSRLAQAKADPAGPGDGKADSAGWMATFRKQASSKSLDVEYNRCLEAHSDRVPAEIGDCYEAERERLIEQEARQERF